MKKIQDMEFDINTMCDFEQLTGKSLMKVLNDSENISMTDIRALIQAGTGAEDPEQAGTALMEYLKEENAQPILTLISEKLDSTGMTKKKK